MKSTSLNRREMMCGGLAALSATGFAASQWLTAAEKEKFQFQYMLPSSMYGCLPLSEILPETRRIGAAHIDIWPKVHGDQREQVDAMGEEAFRRMLASHDVKLGCITQYKLGPFGLQNEMRFAKRFSCPTIVTGGRGPRGLSGQELKKAVGGFIEQMKPHLEIAAETGVTIAVENHGNNLIESPDSLKWLAELRPSSHLAIALAPYHLPQDEKLLAGLIRDLGHSIAVFYAWQHGMGCSKKLPKEQELLQMPGRGELDFQPLVSALKDIRYRGWTEIFMHPVPRGIPILETAREVSTEINQARTYLDDFIQPS